MWNAFLDKMFNLDHLQSRGWNLANKCVMCRIKEESDDHLFVLYDMAYEVWSFFLSHLCISWPMPYHFCDLFSGWWIYELEGLSATI